MKTFIITSFLLFVFISSSLQAQTQFQDIDWSTALKKAGKENKYVMVDCFTTWCYWCKVMDKQTFPNQVVGKFANSHFVPIKMDMEKASATDLKNKYHVNSYPTYLFFDSKGSLIYKVIGYEDSTQFLKSIEEAVNPTTQLHLKGYNSTIKLVYPDFYGQEPLSEEVLVSYFDKENNLFSEVNWAVLSRYSGYSIKYTQFVFDNRQKYREAFGKDVVNELLNNNLEKQMDSALNNKDEALMFKYIGNLKKYELLDEKEQELNIQLHFYSTIRDYKKLMVCIESWIKTTGNDTNAMLNNYCWGIYAGCDDSQIVHRAAEIMEKVAAANGFSEMDAYESGMDAHYCEMDTYAALLFKDKQYNKAEQEALSAIEAEKKAKASFKTTEQLLGFIKAEKSSGLIYSRRKEGNCAIEIGRGFFPVFPTADTIQLFDAATFSSKDSIIYYNGLHYTAIWYEQALKELANTEVSLFSIKNIKGAGLLNCKLIINFGTGGVPYEANITDGEMPKETALRILQLKGGDILTFKYFYQGDGGTVFPTEVKIKVLSN